MVRVRERRERVMGLRMTERGGEAGSDAQGCSGVRGVGGNRGGAGGGGGGGGGWGGGGVERACLPDPDGPMIGA